MKKIQLSIKGMHCSSCEVLIERALRKVPGVEKVHVSRAKEEARVTCADDLDLAQLQAAVQEGGYTLSCKDGSCNDDGSCASSKPRYGEIAAIFVILLGVYWALKQFDFFPSLGVTENMSYGFIFVLGLVAATSTCLAVSGGLLLAIAAKFNARYPHLTKRQKFIPHVYFNIGRILSYTILGGLIGVLGSFLTISPRVTGLLTLFASVVMIVTGLQLLHIFPWLNRLQLKMPKFLAHRIYDASGQEGGKSNRWSSFLFGASTFFLPCGFTQALQIYVLSKGDFTTGALTMLAFSLGTLPALLSVGAVSSFSKGSFKRRFMTFAAVLVVILGIFNVPNGLALTGVTLGSTDLGQGSVGKGNQPSVADVQVVEMKVVGLQYTPSRFTVVQGVPVEWRIDGTKARGCAQVITAPKLGITEYLPKNEVKVIRFTPQKVGKIPFHCTMGMTTPGAAFEVVPNSNKGDSLTGGAVVKGAVQNEAANPEKASQQACNSDYQDCNVQRVSMEISQERGFYPNTFTVKKGVPVEMEIDAKVKLGGCMGTMVIPAYDVAHTLSLGKTVLRFTPTKTGTIPFTCSMGSHLGDFIVI